MSFRLLIISSAFPPFKAPESAHVLFLARRLAGEQVDVHLLTTRGNGGDGTQADGITLHPIMPDWTWRQMPRLARFLYQNHPDAILLLYIDWIYGSHPMITFLPWIARRLVPAARFVTQFENENGLTGVNPPDGLIHRAVRRTMDLLAGPSVDRSYGTLLRDSSRIIVLSELHLGAFSQVLPTAAQKAQIIAAPPSLQIAQEDAHGSVRKRGRARLGLGPDHIAIIYFGYIYPLKDLETLLIAFAQMPQHTRLVIIGEGEEDYVRTLRETSREAGRSEHVTWTGHCGGEDASVYLHSADFCVLPFVDGLRMNNSSFAAAVTHGLPVISTRGRTVEKVFIDEVNVRLCAPRDPLALAAAMSELATAPELRMRLGQGARKLAQQTFSPDRIIQSTLKVLSPVEA